VAQRAALGFNPLRRFRGLRKRSTWLVAIGTGVGVLALHGIIGNRADAATVYIFTTYVQPLMNLPNLLLAGCSAVAGWIARHMWTTAADRGLSTTARMLELDDSLMRAIPGLAQAADRDQRLERLLTEYLRDCTKLFVPDVSRAWILQPEGDWLVPWVAYQVPNETLTRTRFYIGPPDPSRERGLAGEAFATKRLRVAHLTEKNGKWTADDGCYIVFDPDRPFPPYRSLVAIPISPAAPDQCYGVLCLDSVNETIFDGGASQQVIVSLGTRLVAPIKLYRDLQASMPGPTASQP
jgi:hypothetical protein